MVGTRCHRRAGARRDATRHLGWDTVARDMDLPFIAFGVGLFVLVFGAIEFLDDILDRFYPTDEEIEVD